MSTWQIGVPEVPAGKMRRFIAATKRDDGSAKPYVRVLCYGNAYPMPASDAMCGDMPANAVPIGDSDDGEYAWTGWFEEACDQCDTYWDFPADRVLAFAAMPTITADEIIELHRERTAPKGGEGKA